MRLFIQLVIAIAAIAQVSAEQRSDTILIQGNPAGSQRVQTDQAGVTQVEYSYNDRGRGDHLEARRCRRRANCIRRPRKRLHESASRRTIRNEARNSDLEESLRTGK